MKRMKLSRCALVLAIVFLTFSIVSCADTSDTTMPEETTTVDGETSIVTDESPDTTEPISQFNEAPDLANRVANGELDPVNERLPINPLVLVPHERIGQYGGIWRQSVPIGNKIHAMAGLGYYAGRALVVWNEDKSEIVPNIAESFSVSEDATTFTFTLRDGLRWSDGEPMTTEDVAFWWESFATNMEINPAQAQWEGVEVNIIDELTFEIKYPEAKPLQLNSFAGYAWSTFFMPKHYLAQFHPDYADEDELKDIIESAGFGDWVQNFGDRNDYQNNPDLPVMSPWVLSTEGAAATQLIFERNPYYFVVDTDGNQLPYIDRCIINVVESVDITKMRAVSGEFELAFAAIMEDFSDYPLFAENAESGDYTIRLAEFDEPNAMNIHFNITHQDEEKRTFIEMVEFRQAMSLAINRPEIIAINYTVGPHSSVIRQFSPYPESPFYSEALSYQFTEFDRDRANQILDEIGLDQKNNDGVRLLPNGVAFDLVVDVPSYSDQWIDIGVMLADNWKAVGINASARSVDPSLWNERRMSNDYDCTIMTGGGGLPVLSRGDVNSYTGYDTFDWPNTFASGNYIWRNTDGDEGVAPSPEILRLWELGSSIENEPDDTARLEMLEEVIQIHVDNLFILGIGTRLPAIYLVKNYMHNVPDLDPSWSFGCTGHGRPEQYFIDQ